MRRHAGLAAALLLLSAQAALAHPGHGGAAGLAHGFAHPFSGADHLLAMVAVGLLAAAQGGRALWAVPLAFLGMMAVGGMLGAAGTALPFVETGIEVFGVERCMMESNFPPDGRAGGFVPTWNAYKYLTRAFSEDERRDLFGRNAARIYRIDVPGL